ncbi:MAG: ABC transporter permease, partial [Gammaproteobacteria bacterium]|nr:ABC transporter permease [Gammaproteobacteria bacterium]
MSPLVQRGLANFKANKRGFYSLWIFLGLFVLSLLAEFISNDRPILLLINGDVFFPVIEKVTEREIGGELTIEADYKSDYIRDLFEEKDAFALWPLIPYHHTTVDFFVNSATPANPSAQHWLGTDDRGKDTLARLIYGFRLSVLFGVTVTFLSAIIGVTLGAIQGYFGGLIDLFGQRLVEIWSGLPVLLILIILSTVVEERNVFFMIIILAAFSWMSLVAVVRAEFLRTRNFDYVRAARSLGVPNQIIMRRHVLPNAMVATLTNLPFILCGAVTQLTALDFLGFGLPEGSPSLGELLRQG